ncbi:MAG TPA: trigger factor [Chitinophagales bacterium]|nr:trigger factor [Chitinophagales bacterium]
MNISLNKTDELNAVISVDVKTEDYLPAVKKTLHQHKQTEPMKGFRKGFVPEGLIKKMYGNGIMLDEINKLVTDGINKYIDEEKLDFLGRPLPKADADIHFDINSPQDFVFEYELGLTPEFTLKGLDKKNKIEKKVVVIDDKTLNDEMDNLARRYGNATHPEDGIEDKDILTLELTELDGKKEKENGVTHTAVVGLDMFKDDKVKAKFLKAKLGDAITIKPYEVFDNANDYVSKSILGLVDGNPEGLSDSFKATISKVTRLEKAAFNQELFDKIYGPGVVESEEKFKERLKNELEDYAQSSTNNQLKKDIYDSLMEKNNIALPDAFLKRFIKVSNEKPISDEQIEQEYPAFEKGLRWNLITAKIAKDNQIKVEHEEVSNFSKEQLKKQLAMYNPTGAGIEDEYLDIFNNNMLAKEDHAKKSYEGAMEQKLFSFIENQIGITDKSVSFEEFFKK